MGETTMRFSRCIPLRSMGLNRLADMASFPTSGGLLAPARGPVNLSTRRTQRESAAELAVQVLRRESRHRESAALGRAVGCERGDQQETAFDEDPPHLVHVATFIARCVEMFGKVTTRVGRMRGDKVNPPEKGLVR